MNDFDNKIDTIKKDYLAQKFPGNLGEWVTSKTTPIDRAADTMPLVNQKSMSDKNVIRFFVLAATIFACLLSAATWYSHTLRNSGKIELAGSARVKTETEPKPVLESLANRKLASKRVPLKINTMSLAAIGQTDLSANLASKPLPSLGLFLPSSIRSANVESIKFRPTLSFNRPKHKHNGNGASPKNRKQKKSGRSRPTTQKIPKSRSNSNRTKMASVESFRTRFEPDLEIKIRSLPSLKFWSK